jgi:hypothetical protein
MEIRVDFRIAAQARRCKREFACLSGDLAHLCKVEDVTAGALHLLDDTDVRVCGYRVQFGYNTVLCLCPVRQEIYRRYEL